MLFLAPGISSLEDNGSFYLVKGWQCGGSVGMAKKRKN